MVCDLAAEAASGFANDVVVIATNATFEVVDVVGIFEDVQVAVGSPCGGDGDELVRTSVVGDSEGVEVTTSGREGASGTGTSPLEISVVNAAFERDGLSGKSDVHGCFNAVEVAATVGVITVDVAVAVFINAVVTDHFDASVVADAVSVIAINVFVAIVVDAVVTDVLDAGCIFGAISVVTVDAAVVVVVGAVVTDELTTRTFIDVEVEG